MQLALECHTELLDYIQPFADIDWILAKEAIKDKKYLEHFKDSTKLKFVSGISTDAEEPPSPSDVHKVYSAVNGTYVVPPVYWDSIPKSIESYNECVKLLGMERVVGVALGATPALTVDCANLYGPIVAVPYDACGIGKGSMTSMAEERALIISNISPDRVVHLLGFISLDEFYWYHNRPNVVSINTGVPILLGLQGLEIESLEDKSRPTFSQMKSIKLEERGWTAVLRNLALLRRYMP